MMLVVLTIPILLALLIAGPDALANNQSVTIEPSCPIFLPLMLSDYLPLCATQSEISHAECIAMVALHNRTNGRNWTNDGSWLVTNTPCNWVGVACDDAHITVLRLNAKNLSGNIPPELGRLSSLEVLNLSDNQLCGVIPSELGDLSNLEQLDLSNNQLSGNIPLEIGKFSNLVGLNLWSNQFRGGIPPELGKLNNLTGLSLFSNQLNGDIPAELGKLSNLEELILFENDFIGSIPPNWASSVASFRSTYPTTT